MADKVFRYSGLWMPAEISPVLMEPSSDSDMELHRAPAGARLPQPVSPKAGQSSEPLVTALRDMSLSLAGCT